MKECLEEHKPSKRPTEPEMEADEINDPRRPRPSRHAHVFVSIVCFLTIKYLYSYNPNSERCDRNEELIGKIINNNWMRFL